MSLNFNYASPQPNILQNVQDLTSNVVNQFIVRPLGSPNLIGISGFIFDILDEEEISLDSDITDHYVEANYAIQDHIALRPIRFTLRGFAGELVDDNANALATIYTQLKGLETLGGLAPQFNVQDAQFYAAVNNVVQKTTAVVNQAKSLFQLFGNSSTTANRQQKVYQYFSNMWKTRQLVSVETPFDVFDNMAIESIRALQNGDTRFISDFTITFKQILTVKSITLTNKVDSLLSQNFGSTSNLPNVAGGDFQSIVDNPVSLGSDAGSAVDKNGNSFTVGNTLQATYLQQQTLPNVY